MTLKLGVMPVPSGRGGADPRTTRDFVRLVEELGCEFAAAHTVLA